jgi:tRNA(Ile)-lysidine synthase
MDLLDDLAEAAYADLGPAPGVDALRRQPTAIRRRVLRSAALAAGATDAELFHVHVQALDDLVAGTLRGEVQLPGHVTAHLDGGCLRFRRTAVRS